LVAVRQLIAKFKQNSSPWKYFLLGLFLFAQSFAASHEISHIGQDIQDETCILCQSNDNNPIDAAHPKAPALLDTATDPQLLKQKLALFDGSPRTLTARGPPIA
tara:strand:+ start:271 stop:582 length:312 start_codon:yes stop_codon:yes gene_type:complete